MVVLPGVPRHLNTLMSLSAVACLKKRAGAEGEIALVDGSGSRIRSHLFAGGNDDVVGAAGDRAGVGVPVEDGVPVVGTAAVMCR